jgi:hypothetical protein
MEKLLQVLSEGIFIMVANASLLRLWQEDNNPSAWDIASGFTIPWKRFDQGAHARRVNMGEI